MRFLLVEPFAFAFFEKDVAIFFQFVLAFIGLWRHWVNDFHLIKVQLVLFDQGLDSFDVAQQNWRGNFLFAHLLSRFEYRQVFGIGQHDPFGALFCLIHDRLGQGIVQAEAFRQLGFVGIPVQDWELGNASFHGCAGHCWSNRSEQAGVDGLGDNVLPTKNEVVFAVSHVDHIGNRLFGQIGQSTYGGQLHFFIDHFGAHVECTAKDIRETQNVVDLIGVIAAASGEDDVFAGGHGFFVGNFGRRICHGKNDAILGHDFDHFLIHHIAFRQSDKNIGAS